MIELRYCMKYLYSDLHLYRKFSKYLQNLQVWAYFKHMHKCTDCTRLRMKQVTFLKLLEYGKSS